MTTSATIGPAIRTNVQRDKVKWRCRLIGVSDAFLALSMMLRWVQLKWKSEMAVALPRLSLFLSPSLFFFFFLSASLPVLLLTPSLSSLLFILLPFTEFNPHSLIYVCIFTDTHVWSASCVSVRALCTILRFFLLLSLSSCFFCPSVRFSYEHADYHTCVPSWK